MLYHLDGTTMLSHFIRPRHVLTLLETGGFNLVRADQQPKDPDDSKLPAMCFDQPHRGSLEKSLGLSSHFLKSQAHAIAALRARTFIMPWTYAPAGDVRDAYSENGLRCELRASELQLMGMLGYFLSPEARIPPKSRPTPEFPGGRAGAELKEPHYSSGTAAIPVVATPSATAHKDSKFFSDSEIRIESIVTPDHVAIGEDQKVIKWSVESFAGLTISIGAKTPLGDAEKIKELASKLGIPVSGIK